MNLRDTNAGKRAGDLNRLLDVSTAQIRSILNDGSQSIDELTNYFYMIGKFIDEIKSIINSRDKSDYSSKINNSMDNISYSLNKALISFQFYDRHTQRLQHVIDGIDIISKGIKSRGCAENWDDLYHKIRDNYTLSEEQSVFEVMMGKGTSPPKHNTSNKQDVDLF